MRYTEPSFDEMLEEAQERRENNEWALGPECPEVGKLAHVLLKHLIYNGDINQEEENIDVYSMFPLRYDYYDLTQFKVLKEDISDRVYAVGNYRDTKDSANNYLEEVVDDAGVDGKTMRRYVDEDRIVDDARDWYTDWIYQSPEDYCSEDERLTSREQDDMIDFAERKIARLEEQIKQIESHFAGESENKGLSKINHLNELIGELEEEIEEIKSNPEGDFSEASIQNAIDTHVEDVAYDPVGFLDNFGFEYKTYFDKQKYIDDVIDIDGFGTLSPYDGESNEVYLEGETYYVFRIE